MGTKYAMPDPVGHIVRTMEQSAASSRFEGIEAAELKARPRLVYTRINPKMVLS